VLEVDRICDLAVKRFRDWTEAVRRAMEHTEDLDEIVRALGEEARRDTETGAESTLDLDRLEVLSSVRMNAMGIVRYWQLRRAREDAVQES
jgi:hypothetical protein